jgi:hypothetical protein
MTEDDEFFKDIDNRLRVLNKLLELAKSNRKCKEEEKEKELPEVIQEFYKAQVWAFGKNHAQFQTSEELQDKYMSKHGKHDPIRLISEGCEDDQLCIYAFELGRLYYKYNDKK